MKTSYVRLIILFLFTSVIETQVGLVVACMPLMAKMLSHHLPESNAFRKRLRSHLRLSRESRQSKFRELSTDGSSAPLSDRSGSDQSHELGQMKGRRDCMGLKDKDLMSVV